MPHAPGGTEAQHFAAIVFEKIDGLADVGIGFAPGLAGFVHLQGGKFAASSPSVRRHGEQIFGAKAKIGIPPGGIGRPGRMNGLLRFGDAGRGNPCHHLGRGVGVDRRDFPAGLDGRPANDEREPSGKAFAHALQGLRKALAWFGQGPVPQRLITKGTSFARDDGLLLPGWRGRMLRQDFSRAAQQLLDGKALCEPLTQERLVGRVFEQAAHQVSHALQHFANGGVHAHGQAGFAQSVPDRFPHAVDDLVFDIVGGRLQFLGRFHDAGNGAQVVGGAGQPGLLAAFQDDPGQLLEVGVGFGLIEKYRDGPVVLPGPDDLGVPVGPLDQAGGEPDFVLARPLQQVVQIPFAVAAVTLDGDAGVGVVVKLGFFHEAAIERQGEVFEAVVLHV